MISSNKEILTFGSWVDNLFNYFHQARSLLVEALRTHEACIAVPVPVPVNIDTEDEDGEGDARTGGGEAPADRPTLPVSCS